MNLPDNITLQATLDGEGAKNKLDRPSTISEFFAWLGRISILLALIASPWMFGSVQHFAQYWMAIALLFGLGFWWFETALNRDKKQVLPYIFFLVAFGIVLGGIQLIPLPDFARDVLAGRQTEFYERYTVDGEVLALAAQASSVPSKVTTRLSLDREGTWEQIRLIFIAIAGLLLGCRLFRERRDLIVLFSALAINGTAIAFFGLLQKLSATRNTIYWVIELTQGGQPFGPFVNRNNASGYLLLCLAASIGLIGIIFGTRKNAGPVPLISKEMPPWRQFYFHFLYFISELTATKVACLMGAILISTGVISSLSRGGVVSLLVGSIGTLLIYGMARRPKHTGFILIPLVGLVIALSSWVGFGDQLIARFERMGTDLDRVVASEARFQNWRDTYPAVREMGLFGSGLGSYQRVHRIYRTDRENTIFVFAENQYFQALVEAGWPGLVVFVLAWVLCWMYVSLLINRGKSDVTVAVGTMGVFLVLSQATASFLDFGLYIPAITLTMSVLVGCLAFHAHALAGRLKKRSWLQLEAPNVMMQVILLAVFAGITLACMDLNRQTKIDQLSKINIRQANRTELDLKLTEEKIKALSPLLSRSISVSGLNTLAELWVHRCRLELWNELQQLPAFNRISGENEGEIKRRLWDLTRLSRMHEVLAALELESEALAADFVGREFIPYNLGYARRYFSLSRFASPLQSDVHLQIGRINAIYGRDVASNFDLERAVELSPANAEIRIAAAIIFLQQGEFEKSGAQFRKSLELNPATFRKTIELVTGQADRSIRAVSERQVFEMFLPEDPKLFFQFAMNHIKNDEELRSEVLRKADVLLGEVSPSRREDLLLSANIKLARGFKEEGRMLLGDVLVSNPGEHEIRFRLAKLYFNDGLLTDALEEVALLTRFNKRNREYLDLEEKIEKAIKAENQKSNSTAD